MNLSIVILSCNKELLSQCVSSIKEKTKGITFEILTNLHKTDDGLTLSAGYNKLIEKAQGKYICVLSDDVIIYNDALTILYNYMESYSSCGIVGPKTLNGDLSFQNTRRRFPTVLWTYFEMVAVNYLFPNNPINMREGYKRVSSDTPMKADCIGGACMLMKKDLRFDEKLQLYFEDIDICQEAYKKGYYVYYLPKAKIIHLGHQTIKNMADREKLFKQSRRYYFHKY